MTDPFRIDADLLIPGRGIPVRDGTVVVESGSVRYAGSRAEAPDIPVQATVPTVLPGLWDVHVHLVGTTTASFEVALTTSPALAGARLVKDLEAMLRAGYTSVRDAAGLGIWIASAVDDGTIAGPTIYGAGAAISPTGGHADVHSYPEHWVHPANFREQYHRTADGVAECLKAVRSQLRNNARVIKVCASGGVVSVVDQPQHQQFSSDELRVMVEEAARADRAVMAHCHGKRGIMAAIEAGVRTIEHGSYVDEEAAAAMREKDIILVPTRTIIDVGLRQLDTFPRHVARKFEEIADDHARAMAVAHDAGVTFATGSDMVTAGPTSHLSFTHMGGEAALLARAGLSPLEAIEAATANGPLTLGPQAPRSGRLAPGYDADLIALDIDPLEHLDQLGQEEHVLGVWKGGELLHSTLGLGG
ncbi:metal-dependent hydrolase family protein [Nocardia vaccinii]|uniref:metal-dependent hydrolase family protein n=1 Tax=Nocardia vaccinii TaxID=1822 RepID=UPI00082E2652|nr:amidohydrolase family protein [Nocardia vaccinii]